MWSGSFLFSKSNGKNANISNQPQQKLSPFGASLTTPANGHRASGGVVPPILLEESRVPKFYKDCLASCGAVNSSQLPNTSLVYNLMVASQLPKDSLSDIWNMVNRTIPGQLTRPEFFSCLALIALAQKDENISALCDVTTLPIPHLQTFTEGGIGKPSAKNNSMNSKTVIETSDLRMETKASSIQSSKKEMRDNLVEFSGKKNGNFVPVNLMNNSKTSLSHEKKGESNDTMLVDLIGDFCSKDASESVAAKKQEQPNYDFLNLDFTLPTETSSESTPRLTSHEFDPYAVLREGPPEDEHLITWQSILREGIKILKNSIALLENSPTSTEEVSQTETGIKFIQSIRAIADVIERVTFSMSKHRENEDELTGSAHQSLSHWKELIKKSYIFKALEEAEDPDSGYLLDEISSVSTTYPKEHMFCGICIHQIAFDDSAFLNLAGIHYHSSCANFWANIIIDISLPRLERL